MRNQRSWRLLTEIEPNDSNIQVSKVIWKVDSNWQPFYPLFIEETTVVLMSDDKKTFETCKATADWTGNMTLTKRWLSDDKSETVVASFKRDWLPWTYMFATMWAWDLPALNDDNVWTWDQTFNGDMDVNWDFNVTWNFTMDASWDIGISTNIWDVDIESDSWDIDIKTNSWTVTFKDKDVWPLTLQQMVSPPLSWSAIEVMSEADFQQITPVINTAYFRYINL